MASKAKQVRSATCPRSISLSAASAVTSDRVVIVSPEAKVDKELRFYLKGSIGCYIVTLICISVTIEEIPHGQA